jgi:hypothetical protein
MKLSAVSLVNRFGLLVLFVSAGSFAAEPPVANSDPTPNLPEDVRSHIEELQVPVYQRVRPEWGADLSYSYRGLGSSTVLTSAPTAKRLSTFSFRLEYQPQFLQSFGVFSLGPSFQYMNLPTEISGSGLACYSLGGQARYQLKLLREQWVVPYVGFGVERVSYALKSGTKSAFVSKGAFFGASVLLNIFEPATAAEAFAGTGIARTYFFAELRSVSGGDKEFPVSGRSTFFGLRFEY